MNLIWRVSILVNGMANGLHLYSAFTDPMATKALYRLPHIHPFIFSQAIYIFPAMYVYFPLFSKLLIVGKINKVNTRFAGRLHFL